MSVPPNNGSVRKGTAISFFLVLMFLISITSSGMIFGIQSIYDYRWLTSRGGYERKTYCKKTIHFPYSALWNAVIPQTHSILAYKDYLIVIRPTEAIVFQHETKSELHTVEFDGKCLPVVYNGFLMTVNNNVLEGHNLSDGLLEFEYNIDQGDPLFLLPYDDFIIIVTDSNYLIKVSDSNVVSKLLPNEISTSPVISGDKVVVACNDYNIYFYDFDLNQVAVSSPIGEVTDLVGFDGKSVVAVRKGGGSVALALEDGKRIWSNLYPKGRNLHAVSDGSKMYLLGSDSGIVAIRPDGRTIWTNRKISPSYSGISGRLILVCTRDGLLHPIQTSTGQSHMLYATPGNVTSTPTILDDKAFLICGPNIVELSTSPYNKYLGFECNLDFDLLCPEKVYKRDIFVKNISDNIVNARIYCMVKNASVSEESLKLVPGQTANIELTVKTFGEIKLQEWGELIIDTSSYRYRLGVRYVVEQIPGDCNLDCKVDATDLIIIATCMGKRSYHQGYKKAYDFDENGIIDNLDVEILIQNFGVDRN